MTGPTAAAQPVSAVYGGIRYAGELVRAAAWEPSLGSALDGDVYFKVVFLESPLAPPAGDLRDGRIAVHVPGPPSPARRRAEAELRTLREAQAGYAADVGDALAAQAHEIEEHVVEEWASSFRDGQVVAFPQVDLDVAAVFASGYWSAWAERIGQELLARAYPSLPVDAAKLSAPLRPGEDAPALFEAVRAEGSEIGSVALDAFGPALGIARTGRGSIDLSRCAGVGLVAAEAERHGGAALGHRLAHALGLTYPLATLFALLSVLRGSAEVRLAPAHHLRLRGGAALDPPRITADVVAHLAWPTRFWPDVDGIGPAGAPQAEGSWAYLDVLGVADDTALRGWLGTMSDGLLSVTQHLMALAAAQGRELGAGDLDALARVRRLIEVEDPAGIGARARELFGGVGPFRAGMELWTAWRDGLEHAAALTGAVAFLERATVEEEVRRELSLEREALARRLHDPALLTSPQQWPALAEAARRFSEAYADAYVEHHDAYHLRMELLAHRMAGVGAQGRALARLNAVPELGRPIAPELPGLCEELRSLVRACGAALEREAIARDAVCPSCAIRLDAVPPAAEVEALATSVGEALGEQNARLARAVAHRLLKREANERLDRFIQVVEVSDLSGLANVLDDELTVFLGALLREERS